MHRRILQSFAYVDRVGVAHVHIPEALFHPPSFDFWPLLLLRLSEKMRNNVSGKKEERGGGEGEREEDCIS